MKPSDQIPPQELRGAAGQVGDAGGAGGHALPRVPAPSIVSGGSPGLSTGAATIPLAPTHPSDDPASMAILIAQMANEMFLGASVVPVIMSPNTASHAAAESAVLSSPGVSPGVLMGMPSIAGGGYGLPTSDAQVMPPATGAPSAAFGSPTTYGSAPHDGGGGLAPGGTTGPEFGSASAASIPSDDAGGVEQRLATSPFAQAPTFDAVALGSPAGSSGWREPLVPSREGTTLDPSAPSASNGFAGSAIPSSTTLAPAATGIPGGSTTTLTPAAAGAPSNGMSAAWPTSNGGSGGTGGTGIDGIDSSAGDNGDVFGSDLGTTTTSTPTAASDGLAPAAPTSTALTTPTGAPKNGLSSAWSAPSGGGSGTDDASHLFPSSGAGGPASATPPSLPGTQAPASPFGTSSPPVSPPSNPTGGSAVPVAGVPTSFGALTTAPLSPSFIPVAPSPIPDPRTAVAAPPELPGSVDQHVERGRPSAATIFDPYAVRKDFPILDERVHDGKRLIWLDNAATTQKPNAVIDRLTHFYRHENSNIHRAAHTLAARATDAYENARESTRRFLNAPSAGEIIFVRGATEGINLIAKAWGARNIGAGDEIIVTHLEHHANIVPWQQLCAQTGAKLRVAPVDDNGDLILEEFEKCFNARTKLASFTQVSNALGSITPAREMVAIARRYGVCTVVDGAQAVSHMRVDVQALDCDFYVFSGHKVFAPTGIGAVFGKRSVLEVMQPWQGGGNMIADVTFESTKYQPPPFRFEAGTGNIADAVGMGAALDYVMRIGMDVIDRYEHELLVYATAGLATVPGLHMLGPQGPNPHKAGVLSFVLDGRRTEDVGALLDKEGIAVRSGHHCAQPILRRFGQEASVRASLAFYNIREDIDALVVALHKLQRAR